MTLCYRSKISINSLSLDLGMRMNGLSKTTIIALAGFGLFLFIGLPLTSYLKNSKHHETDEKKEECKNYLEKKAITSDIQKFDSFDLQISTDRLKLNNRDTVSTSLKLKDLQLLDTDMKLRPIRDYKVVQSLSEQNDNLIKLNQDNKSKVCDCIKNQDDLDQLEDFNYKRFNQNVTNIKGLYTHEDSNTSFEYVETNINDPNYKLKKNLKFNTVDKSIRGDETIIEINDYLVYQMMTSNTRKDLLDEDIFPKLCLFEKAKPFLHKEKNKNYYENHKNDLICNLVKPQDNRTVKDLCDESKIIIKTLKINKSDIFKVLDTSQTTMDLEIYKKDTIYVKNPTKNLEMAVKYNNKVERYTAKANRTTCAPKTTTFSFGYILNEDNIKKIVKYNYTKNEINAKKPNAYSNSIKRKNSKYCKHESNNIMDIIPLQNQYSNLSSKIKVLLTLNTDGWEKNFLNIEKKIVAKKRRRQIKSKKNEFKLGLKCNLFVVKSLRNNTDTKNEPKLIFDETLKLKKLITALIDKNNKCISVFISHDFDANRINIMQSYCDHLKYSNKHFNIIIYLFHKQEINKSIKNEINPIIKSQITLLKILHVDKNGIFNEKKCLAAPEFLQTYANLFLSQLKNFVTSNILFSQNIDLQIVIDSKLQCILNNDFAKMYNYCCAIYNNIMNDGNNEIIVYYNFKKEKSRLKINKNKESEQKNDIVYRKLLHAKITNINTTLHRSRPSYRYKNDTENLNNNETFKKENLCSVISPVKSKKYVREETGKEHEEKRGQDCALEEIAKLRQNTNIYHTDYLSKQAIKINPLKIETLTKWFNKPKNVTKHNENDIFTETTDNKDIFIAKKRKYFDIESLRIKKRTSIKHRFNIRVRMTKKLTFKRSIIIKPNTKKLEANKLLELKSYINLDSDQQKVLEKNLTRKHEKNIVNYVNKSVLPESKIYEGTHKDIKSLNQIMPQYKHLSGCNITYTEQNDTQLFIHHTNRLLNIIHKEKDKNIQENDEKNETQKYGKGIVLKPSRLVLKQAYDYKKKEIVNNKVVNPEPKYRDLKIEKDVNAHAYKIIKAETTNQYLPKRNYSKQKNSSEDEIITARFANNIKDLNKTKTCILNDHKHDIKNNQINNETILSKSRAIFAKKKIYNHQDIPVPVLDNFKDLQEVKEDGINKHPSSSSFFEEISFLFKKNTKFILGEKYTKVKPNSDIIKTQRMQEQNKNTILNKTIFKHKSKISWQNIHLLTSNIDNNTVKENLTMFVKSNKTFYKHRFRTININNEGKNILSLLTENTIERNKNSNECDNENSNDDTYRIQNHDSLVRTSAFKPTYTMSCNNISKNKNVSICISDKNKIKNLITNVKEIKLLKNATEDENFENEGNIILDEKDVIKRKISLQYNEIITKYANDQIHNELDFTDQKKNVKTETKFYKNPYLENSNFFCKRKKHKKCLHMPQEKNLTDGKDKIIVEGDTLPKNQRSTYTNNTSLNIDSDLQKIIINKLNNNSLGEKAVDIGLNPITIAQNDIDGFENNFKHKTNNLSLHTEPYRFYCECKCQEPHSQTNSVYLKSNYNLYERKNTESKSYINIKIKQGIYTEINLETKENNFNTIEKALKYVLMVRECNYMNALSLYLNYIIKNIEKHTVVNSNLIQNDGFYKYVYNYEKINFDTNKIKSNINVPYSCKYTSKIIDVYVTFCLDYVMGDNVIKTKTKYCSDFLSIKQSIAKYSIFNLHTSPPYRNRDTGILHKRFDKKFNK